MVFVFFRATGAGHQFYVQVERERERCDKDEFGARMSWGGGARGARFDPWASKGARFQKVTRVNTV